MRLGLIRHIQELGTGRIHLFNVGTEAYSVEKKVSDCGQVAWGKYRAALVCGVFDII
jgi:hypothetical protein